MMDKTFAITAKRQSKDLIASYTVAACLAAAGFLAPAAPAYSMSGPKIVTSVNVEHLSKRRKTKLGLYLSSKDAHEALEKNPEIIFVDVRTRAEFSLIGHPKSIDKNIPFAHWAGKKLNEKRGLYPFVKNRHFIADMERYVAGLSASKDTDIFVICRSGGRSAGAVDALAAADFTRVWNIVDGFEGGKEKASGHRAVEGWRNDKLPWTLQGHGQTGLLSTDEVRTSLMKKNVGTIDRVIRAVAGLGILSLVFVGPQTYWGLLGLDSAGNCFHQLVSALCAARAFDAKKRLTPSAARGISGKFCACNQPLS